MNSIAAFQDNLHSWVLLGPELCLSLFFLLSILANAFFGQRYSGAIAAAGIACTFLVTIQQWQITEVHLFDNLLLLNESIVLYKLLILISSGLILLVTNTNTNIQQHPKGRSEFYTLLLGTTVGMLTLCMAQHWIMILLSLEMISFGSYLLTAYSLKNRLSAESAAKYVIFGSAATALLIYGFSLLYGYTQSFNPFDEHFLAALSKAPSSGVALALLLVLSGFLFKLSAVPFHFWTPDVYASVPAPVAAFLATAPKIAGFAIVVRFGALFSYPLDSYTLIWPNFPWQNIVAALAILSLFVGNLSALNQQNIQRLLAYSSIAHSGFLLLAMLPFSAEGQSALAFYLLVYSLASILAFYTLQTLQEAYQVETLEDLRGLGKFDPTTSIAFSIALISLIGIPVTAGFIGKFLVFSVGFQAYTVNGNEWILAALIAGLIGTLLSIFYYFQVPLQLFLRASTTPKSLFLGTKNTWIALILTGLLILIGIYPGWFEQAIQSCFSSDPERFYFSP